MVTKGKKQNEANLNLIQNQRKAAIEKNWLRAQRSSTEQSIIDAGRQPTDKKKKS